MSHAGFDDNCESGGIMPCGENVAWQQPVDLAGTVTSTHRDWMNSKLHRDNIEREGMEVVGYGWHACQGQKLYWTGLFGVPK